MNTREFCTELANRMDIPRSDATWAFREVVALMEDLLMNEEEVRLPKIGKLVVVKRGGYFMKDNLRGGKRRYVRKYRYIEFRHYESHIARMSQDLQEDPTEVMEELLDNQEEEF